MRWVILFCCLQVMSALERIALVAAPGADEQGLVDARLVAQGLRHAGYTIDRCDDSEALPDACARFTTRSLRGGVLGVVWYGGPVTVAGDGVRLGGHDGVDAIALVAGLAAAPNCALVVVFEAPAVTWPFIPSPPGCALILSPRPGAERSCMLAEALVARLLSPDAQAASAIQRLRREDPSLMVDTRLPRQISLAPSASAPPSARTTSAERDLARLYLAAMRGWFATVRAGKQVDGHSPSSRIRAWRNFLSAFPADAPDSEEDEAMRGEATQALIALGAANPLAGALSPPVLNLRDGGAPQSDMRWVVEWALSVDADSESSRPARVRAWKAVLRLFPNDDPLTGTDNIWRRIACQALGELGATGAVQSPEPLLATSPSSAAGVGLGVELALADAGAGLRITACSGLGYTLGLAPGRVLAAADGRPLTHITDLEVAMARGRRLGSLTLELTDGTRCALRLSMDQESPQVAAVTCSGTLAAGGASARPELPLDAGVAIITAQLDPSLRLRIRGAEPLNYTPLEAQRTSFVDFAEPIPTGVEIDRRGMSGGVWLLTARPLHLLSLSERLHGARGWSSRITVPTLVGEPLWIEAGSLTAIELTGTDAAGNQLLADPLPALPGLPYRLVIRCAGNPTQLPLQTLRSGGITTAIAHGTDNVDGELHWRVGLDRPWAWR
jgi:hypothetical protein